MELVKPSEEYKNSYIEAVQEFLVDTNEFIRSSRYKTQIPSVEQLKSDFASYIRTLEMAVRGEELPEGYVPYTEFWLVENGVYIGCVSIRHALTAHLLAEGGHIGYDIRPSMRGRGYGSEMLRLTLPYARELGIKKALVTCDPKNTASRKIIEKNGGVFENEVLAKDGITYRRRYWIQ